MKRAGGFLISVLASLLFSLLVSCASGGGTPNTYTVTFDSQAATVDASPSTLTVTEPETTVGTLPTEPSKTGFTFGGWWTEPEGAGTEFLADTEVTENITVYASWTAISYTVTFDSQSASVDASPESITITYPATTVGTLPTEPSRTGYSFDGWWTEPEGGGTEFFADTEVTESITVYASWTAISYTVTFDSQSATTPANPTSMTVTYPETTVGTLPTDPSKTGHTFGGWWTKPSGAGAAFLADTEVTESITVYAKWTANSYTVTFDSQSATTPADPTSMTITYPETTLGTLPTEPSKTGYTFGGWWTEPSGAGTELLADTEITESITVFAKWTPISYTVTFDSQAATTPANPSSLTVTYPETTVGTLPTEPSKSGYTFDGWWTEPAGAGSPFMADTPVTANMTVYAKWSAQPVLVYDNAALNIPRQLDLGGDFYYAFNDGATASPKTVIVQKTNALTGETSTLGTFPPITGSQDLLSHYLFGSSESDLWLAGMVQTATWTYALTIYKYDGANWTLQKTFTRTEMTEDPGYSWAFGYNSHIGELYIATVPTSRNLRVYRFDPKDLSLTQYNGGSSVTTNVTYLSDTIFADAGGNLFVAYQHDPTNQFLNVSYYDKSANSWTGLVDDTDNIKFVNGYCLRSFGDMHAQPAPGEFYLLSGNGAPNTLRKISSSGTITSMGTLPDADFYTNISLAIHPTTGEVYYNLVSSWTNVFIQRMWDGSSWAEVFAEETGLSFSARSGYSYFYDDGSSHYKTLNLFNLYNSTTSSYEIYYITR